MLERDENAFDHLYCVAFRLLDAQWLVKRASYMEFNVSFWRVQYIDCSLFVFRQWHSYLLVLLYQEVLKSTRTQLERELVLDDVLEVKDLPSYTMLDE